MLSVKLPTTNGEVFCEIHIKTDLESNSYGFHTWIGAFVRYRRIENEIVDHGPKMYMFRTIIHSNS